MTSAYTSNQSALLLPKLKDDCDVKSGNPGIWDAQAPKAFNDVASSLDYKAPGEVKSVSSVPTVWARPLSMEMALHNDAYPIREQMITQWQGMLAALALAEVWGFPIKAQLLQLGDQKSNHVFARSLYELLPDSVNTLYTLNNNKHPWEDLYVFTWNNQPVGMTSPSTLVVPSEQGNWEGLQWWKDGQLQSPHNYLNQTEKAQLAFWLNNLSKEIRRYQGESKAIDRIVGLVNGFINSLGVTTTPDFQFSDNPAYFEVEINRGALTALNLPIKVKVKESNVRVVPSFVKPNVNVPPLLIIDPDIATAWNEPPQNISIHEGKTLAALRPEDIETWNRNKTVICLESKDLFLPELKFIDQEGILPGALLPEGTQSLVFKNRNITPLIPLNPILLNYFTPEDLTKKVKLQLVNNGAGGSQVRLTLNLPLYGVRGGNAPQNFFLSKDYPLLEENIIYEVPVLEVWPDFRAEGWKEYYGFYYDAEYGEETFQVSFPSAKEVHSFKERKGSYQTVQMDEFPSFIECKDIYTNTIGLILLATPEEVSLTGKWVVGVDFGTSFTNVYVNKNDKVIERFNLEVLHRKITYVLVETRFPVLFEYFIPESFIPVDKPFPMSTVLTRKGERNTKEDQLSPIFDGRLYIPARNRFSPQETWIKTNLKWETDNLGNNQLFLKHLALQISAIAAKNGAFDIQWSLSFPSAFSPRQEQNYAKTWQKITKELETKTGIKQISPAKDDVTYFRTESLAVAQYFAEYEDHDLVNTTCIDMGGGTSDISIWQDDDLVHQCSVELAGRDLFSQFIEINPNFLKKLDINPDEWTRLKGVAFNAKLDVWMRLEADNWLDKKRDLLEEDKEFQGLLRLMGIGLCGLYFYVGQILSVLHKEDKYTLDEITPVYIGGNGSRLLHWLAEGGEFDKNSEINGLLSRMMSVASGFTDTEELTRLSQNPKDEAACGLVLKDKKLNGLNKKAKDHVIAGENCEIDGDKFSWQDRLEFKGKTISKYQIPDLTQLKLFLDAFHTSLDNLGIDGIKPLEGYEFEKEYPDDPDPEYNQKLWKATAKELRNSLNSIKGDVENISEEPPFILGLKALLKVLAKDWAGK
jgi:hypothetical protein